MRDTNKQMLQCPVCLMMVDRNSHSINYLGHTYAFCSLQCQERFESNPHIYVGQPGHPAPKQHGHEIIKKRTLKLKETLTDDQCFVIELELLNMMGIKKIHVDQEYLSISYDLLQVTVEQIESAIEKTGNSLSLGLGTKLRLAFIHYVEESELDNLEQPGSDHRH